MYGRILKIYPGSLAEELELVPGDKLLKINGIKLRDIIDVSFAFADEEIEMLVEHEDGQQEVYEFDKDYDEELGVEFESAVFDGIRHCANNCLFCFVDQVAPDMRESLNIKDDDYRMSFLYGNFITMTNMVDADFQRIKQFIRTARHCLNKKAARRNDFFANQRTQRAKRGNLLRLKVIHREVFSHFTGHQSNTAHIRFAVVERTHNRQRAVLTKHSAYVELTIRLERKFNFGILNRNLDFAVRTGNRAKRTGRTATVDGRRNTVTFALEASAHNRSCSNHAAHSSAAGIAGMMNITRLLRHFSRITQKYTRLTTHQRKAQKPGFLLFHSLFLLPALKKRGLFCYIMNAHILRSRSILAHLSVRMHMFKTSLFKPVKNFLFAVRPLPVFLTETAITSIFLANKESNIHGNHVGILIVAILPKRRHTVTFFSEEAVAHDLLQLMPAGAIKAQLSTRNQLCVRCSKKRLNIFRSRQVIDAITGRQNGAHTPGQLKLFHILTDKRCFNAPLSSLFFCMPQHTPGQINAHNVYAVSRKPDSQAACTASTFGCAGRKVALSITHQIQIVLSPRVIVIIIHQRIIYAGEILIHA